MKEYDFTLKFSLPDINGDPEHYISQLNEEGCDDALIGIGKRGRIALNFIRESISAKEAVSSAITSVMVAIPGIRLNEAGPDLVGLTDLANILGFSRQNMRKIMLKNEQGFPVPIYDGKVSLWHLSGVLSHLSELNLYDIDDSLIALANMNRTLNICIDRVDIQPELEQLVQSLLS